jgi:hypothetical protein
MRNRRPGVSLLEIVIAMQCTALLLIVLCRVLPLARRQMKDADLQLGGAAIAQNVLEEHLTVPFVQWPESVSVPHSAHTVKLELTAWEQDSRMNLVRVSVLLHGQERYRLETLVRP